MTNMPLLLCLRLFDYITYTILYGTLTLFLIHHQNIPNATALLIAGGFIGLNYGSSLIGGSLLEWVKDLRLPLVLGIFLHFIGIFLFFKENTVLLGLSVFIMGTMAFDSAYFLVLTRSSQSKLSLLQKTLSYNYMGMNVGGLIGFTIGGFLQKNYITEPIIYTAISILIMSLIILVLRWKFLGQIKSPVKKTIPTRLYQSVIYPLVLVMVGVLVFNLLKFPNRVAIIVMSLWMLAYIISWLLIASKKNSEQRKNHSYFLCLLFIYLLFWTVYFVIPTLLAVFLANNVNLHFYNIVFSPAWFINIMCLIIIIGILLTIHVFKRKALNIGRQFAIGLILQILALAALSLGLVVSGQAEVALYWAIIYFVIQALAELALAPISYSSVGQLIEKKNQAFFMGFWLSTLGIAVVLASKISEKIAPYLKGNINDNPVYLHLFLGLMALSFFGLLIIGIQKNYAYLQSNHH